MKNFKLLFFAAFLVAFSLSINSAISDSKKLTEREKRAKVNYKIDNINYWVKMAEKGYIPFNPYTRAPKGVFTGSEIKAFSVITDDSPDVPVTEENSTQSENSVFVDPNDNKVVLNSNNSTDNPATGVYGANDLFTLDGGETWDGEIQGAGEGNSGDPTTSIGLNGRWFVNYIDGGSNYGGMGVSYSDDQGGSWTTVNIAPNPGDLADKNHMWIDNSPDSPYEGNIYVAWTDFGGANNYHVVVSHSSDNGETWSPLKEISSTVGNGFSHGVNLTTGPNGEVYAAWALYEGSGLTETGVGFAKSVDGGETWTGLKAIDNLQGIRDIGTSKNMRAASFPVIECDISNSENRGNLYIVWPNKGVPGVNTGNDIDVYIISSHDQGVSWNTPVKINQDEAGLGHEHFSPWITCDPDNGILSAIFYDDRNVGGNQLETYCANSDDGGETWEDFKVSDVAFTPTPIPGLATGYFGDYIGITANNGMVYPTWTDNRSGHAMTYVSPYETNPLSKPVSLEVEVIFETGESNLKWSYDEAENFQYFNIYRDGELIGTATDTLFSDTLPDYDYYTYKVTAWYGEDFGGESGAARVDTQWGDAHIATASDTIVQNILIDSVETQSFMVYNTGQLDLNFSASKVFKQEANTNDYCTALGGGDEYISEVKFGDYVNKTASDGYGDYSNLDWQIDMSSFDKLYITNGNPYNEDQCGVWVDWDRNGIFDDEPVTVVGSPGKGPYMAVVLPPEGVTAGSFRMRIRITYTGDVLPCGETEFGEVEDYSINIPWLLNAPDEGVVTPGDSAQIDLTFKADMLSPGTYNADLLFNSNDPEMAEKTVAVEMNIFQFMAEASASANGYCAYDTDSVDLMVTTQGTYDTLIYSWTSVPEGFVSSLPGVTVHPNETTRYYVTVSDTLGNVYTDSLLVEVYDVPSVELGEDSTFCGQDGTGVVLDAGNSGAAFLWSNGDTTQTVTVNKENFDYGVNNLSVEVTNEHGCVAADTVQMDMVDCTGIEDHDDLSDVEVYPNPGTGLYFVRINSNNNQDVDIMVFDNSGKVVYQKNGISVSGQNTVSIDLAGKSAGIYQLFVRSGNSLLNKKLVLQ